MKVRSVEMLYQIVCIREHVLPHLSRVTYVGPMSKEVFYCFRPPYWWIKLVLMFRGEEL